MKFNPGKYENAFDEALTMFKADRILERIWDRDHTVWAPEPEEISNRLGWLDIAERMQPQVQVLTAFAESVRADGVRHIVLLGMGGSSLAPEVFSKAFGAAEDYPALQILDSTDPGAILSLEDSIELDKSLFIVASKSGGTVETFSLFKYFYNRVLAEVGPDQVGTHFVAITDPGSKLAETGNRYTFRAVFINDPNIGGRYSALSHFGLVPAALIGVDLKRFLGRAVSAAGESRRPDSPAVRLGLGMGVMANHGRDKLSLVASSAISGLPDWIEQLVAESTGKHGRGILPVVGEAHGPDAKYGDDRFFVGLAMPGDESVQAEIAAAEAAGHPAALIRLDDVYDLAGQLFVWEFATVIAGFGLGIQPFDQPNVESAKVLAREMVAKYHESGMLPEGQSADLTPENLAAFVEGCQPPDYIAIQAYVPSNAETDAALARVQESLRQKTGAAVTVGYGPRFLHSTGQLHKGDSGNGWFIQVTSDAAQDLDIPDDPASLESTMKFNVLKLAQALGDIQALQSADPPRRVIRFHLGAKEDPARTIDAVANGLSSKL